MPDPGLDNKNGGTVVKNAGNAPKERGTDSGDAQQRQNEDKRTSIANDRDIVIQRATQLNTSTGVENPFQSTAPRGQLIIDATQKPSNVSAISHTGTGGYANSTPSGIATMTAPPVATPRLDRNSFGDPVTPFSALEAFKLRVTENAANPAAVVTTSARSDSDNNSRLQAFGAGREDSNFSFTVRQQGDRATNVQSSEVQLAFQQVPTLPPNVKLDPLPIFGFDRMFVQTASGFSIEQTINPNANVFSLINTREVSPMMAMPAPDPIVSFTVQGRDVVLQSFSPVVGTGGGNDASSKGGLTLQQQIEAIRDPKIAVSEPTLSKMGDTQGFQSEFQSKSADFQLPNIAQRMDRADVITLTQSQPASSEMPVRLVPQGENAVRAENAVVQGQQQQGVEARPTSTQTVITAEQPAGQSQITVKTDHPSSELQQKISSSEQQNVNTTITTSSSPATVGTNTPDTKQVAEQPATTSPTTTTVAPTTGSTTATPTVEAVTAPQAKTQPEGLQQQTQTPTATTVATPTESPAKIESPAPVVNPIKSDIPQTVTPTTTTTVSPPSEPVVQTKIEPAAQSSTQSAAQPVKQAEAQPVTTPKQQEQAVQATQQTQNSTQTSTSADQSKLAKEIVVVKDTGEKIKVTESKIGSNTTPTTPDVAPQPHAPKAAPVVSSSSGGNSGGKNGSGDENIKLKGEVPQIKGKQEAEVKVRDTRTTTVDVPTKRVEGVVERPASKAVETRATSTKEVTPKDISALKAKLEQTAPQQKQIEPTKIVIKNAPLRVQGERVPLQLKEGAPEVRVPIVNRPGLNAETVAKFNLQPQTAGKEYTPQEIIRAALTRYLADPDKTVKALMDQARAETNIKIGQIQDVAPGLVKILIQDLQTFSRHNYRVDQATLQETIFKALSELAVAHALTPEQAQLLRNLQVAVSNFEFNKHVDQSLRAEARRKALADQAKHRELTKEEAEALLKARIEQDRKDVENKLKYTDKNIRERAEQLLEQMQQDDPETKYLLDQYNEIIKVHAITGIVIDAKTRKPIRGVDIYGGILGTQKTDIDGKFTFIDVPEGTVYLIAPDKQGYIFRPVYVAGTLTMSEHYVFELEPVGEKKKVTVKKKKRRK